MTNKPPKTDARLTENEKGRQNEVSKDLNAQYVQNIAEVQHSKEAFCGNSPTIKLVDCGKAKGQIL